MVQYFPSITGSLTVNGNLIISGSISTSGSITISGSVASASYAATLEGLGSASFAPAATFNAVSSSYASASGSLSTRVTNLEATTSVVSSSFATTSGSLSSRVSIIEGQDATTGSNTFTGVQYVSQASNAISFTSTASLYTDGGLRVAKDSFISGTAYFNNIIVYGTSSIQYITSSQVDVGTNIITVNTDTPAVRFGGLAVFDSGSTQLTGSILWDSEKNHWVYSNPSGSSYSGGMLMSGPRSSALGDEQGTLNNYVMKGQGGDHITSSQIIDDGTTVRIPGNLQVTGSITGLGNNTFGSSISSTQQITGSFSSTGSFTVNSGSFYVGSNNQIGVNTNSPQSQFVVAAKTGNSASVEINLNNSGYGRIFAYDRTAAAGVNLVLNDPGGNVLIGTTTDGGFKLDVSGTGRFTGALTGTSATFSGNIIAGGSTDDTSGGLYSNIALNGTTYSRYSLLTGGTARARFQFDGTNTSLTTTSTGGKLQLATFGAAAMEFTTNDTLRMTLASAGNLGIGVVPNTWAGTNTKALQVYLGSMAASLTFGTAFTFNSYYDGNWRYVGSYSAGKYEIGGNEHIWYSAPDGTASNVASFTERMRITSTGNIGIGTTPSSWASPFIAIQGGTYGQHIGFQTNGPDIKIGANNYYNSGYIYTTSSNGAAQLNIGGNSGFQFNWAPSGTAGNAVTFTTALIVPQGGSLYINNNVTNNFIDLGNLLGNAGSAIISIAQTDSNKLAKATILVQRSAYTSGVTYTVATLAAQPIANYLTFGISGTYLTINTTGGAGTMAYNALVIPAY
jgi:hypothetical protein